MKKHTFLFLIVLLLFSCKEDEPVNPKIETLDVSLLSASNFLAKGNINTVGTIPVVDYGFIYSTYEYINLFQGTVISLGKNAVAGEFEKNISLQNSAGYYYYNPYFVRAYITNEKGTVYGKIKTFNFPVLSISSVTPLKGKVGDVITITGQNFSSNPQENIVKFNEVLANVKSATSTQLLVEVPVGITSYYYYGSTVPISVTTGTQTIQATQNFQVSPSISDFSPKSGTFGTQITITGSNFYGHSYSIKIGSQTLSSNNITGTSITFSVPTSVTSETLKIAVQVDNDPLIELPGEFSITPPTITGISPSTSISGSLVTISGVNFNSDYYYGSNYNVVKFGDVKATIYTSSSTQIKAYVPTGLTVGNSYVVTVFTGVHTAQASTNFIMGSPSFTDFTPKTASAYSYVTITGSTFGNVSGTVLFGTTQVNIYSWSDTSIQVQVPYNISVGNYKITVNAGGQSCFSSGNITIQ